MTARNGQKTLPHLERLFYLVSVALTTALCALSGCNQTALDTTSAQRELGQVSLVSLGIGVDVLPGVVRASDEDEGSATIRMNAGIGRITLRTDERASGKLQLALRNIHPEATASIRLVRRLTTSSTLQNECPSSDLNIDCSLTPNNTLCRGATASIADGMSTRRDLIVNLGPCREVVIDVDTPEALDESDVSFVVVGRLSDPAKIEEIVAAEFAAGRDHDFYVLLGDSLQNADNGQIASLDAITFGLDEVFIALPGTEELSDDAGASFERRFGAFDYDWTLKNVQFSTFYSAEAQLAPRGLSNLESVLKSQQSEDARWRGDNDYSLPEGDTRALPAFSFTHTPPLDPRGLRENGFLSRAQGAMVMSLLAEYQVHTLFAGRLSANAFEETRPHLRAVASQNPRFKDDEAAYLSVTLSTTAQPSSTRVNARHMTVETISLTD